MKNLISSFTLIFFLLQTGQAQVDYTANDMVVPYDGYFGFGTNLGYYPGWTDEQPKLITRQTIWWSLMTATLVLVPTWVITRAGPTNNPS